MAIRELFDRVLEQYPKAKGEPIGGHLIADLLYNKLPEEISKSISLPNTYRVDGSAGQGRWTDVPWVALLDFVVTESPEKGFYIVYLCSADCSRLFLSLNQGVTSVKKDAGTSAPRVLAARAKAFSERLGSLVKGLDIGPIDLGARKNVIGASYQPGSICSVQYSKGALPTEERLVADLSRFIVLYQRLVEDHLSPPDRLDLEDDEVDLHWEDLAAIRMHKSIERNQKLVKIVKQKQKYKCKVCKFDFQKAYGDLGVEYIEAHHRVPMHVLRERGDTARLDPIKDFWVLCANCHRMVHRMLRQSEHAETIDEFRAKHLKIPVF